MLLSLFNRFVRVVYVKCADSDGSFDAPADIPCDVDSAVKKLSFNVRLLQTFTAESLYQHGLGHKTFRIEEDESGSPKVNIFTSKLTTSEALSMTGDELYNTFSKGKESHKCSSKLINVLLFSDPDVVIKRRNSYSIRIQNGFFNIQAFDSLMEPLSSDGI